VLDTDNPRHTARSDNLETLKHVFSDDALGYLKNPDEFLKSYLKSRREAGSRDQGLRQEGMADAAKRS